MNEMDQIDLLMKLLAIPGGSGHEGPVAAFIKQELVHMGVPADWMTEDKVYRKLHGFSQGNVIVKFPGRRGQQRLLFSAHMDTVPLCKGVEPVQKGTRIVSAGDTALGADNRTAVAALICLADYLLKHTAEAPPVTLLFTVGEEVGLCGAGLVSLPALGNPAMGFNVDGGDPARIVTGAIGADRLSFTVKGRSAHAGMHPDHGVSAGIIASRALAWLEDNEWHGAVTKGKQSGTSNVGHMEGGEATNQVMDRIIIKAETRSHSLSFLDRMSRTWEKAFITAARQQTSSQGHRGEVDCQVKRAYGPFKLPASAPVVKQAIRAAKVCGLIPETAIINGGLDANPLNAKGLPTVTLGAGQHGAHTVDEYADINEFLTGCRLLIEVIEQAG